MTRDVSPTGYVESLEEPQRTDVAALDALIREAGPGLTVAMAGDVIAYGPYRYRYASGRQGEWYAIGLASRKRYISLYISAADDQGYLAERYRERLPRASIGRSCIRFKRLSDVDTDVLREVISEGLRMVRQQALSGDGRITFF